MCGVCGCTSKNLAVESKAVTKITRGSSDRHHSLGPDHKHTHSENHSHPGESVKDSESQSLGEHVHATRHQTLADDDSKLIEIEQDILYRNSQHAEINRDVLHRKSVLALNFVSSPGSGKTTLLEKTIVALSDSQKIYVIEGDQQTSNDADRIRKTGVVAVQINTGRGCHLDAHTIGHAMDDLKLESSGLLFIENVGNLVCPASFDLGERHKVALLSITEGEDKPIKYPDMFAAASVMLINKIDLLPYVNFDLDRCIEYGRRVNPDIHVITLSAQNGEGMDQWLEWISAEQAFLSESFRSRTQSTQRHSHAV
tara:strand:+ start:611 stop:1546 length:936 start_codon:yes stop_codon:yes gene_type:complete